MDALRGVAVLGILLVNINSFALPIDETYSLAPDRQYGMVDTGVFALVSVLAAGKFMSLFSLLFGAGVALMIDRRWQRGEPAAGLHYKRIGTLAVMGFIHGVFIWYGDILLYYAVCGALLYPLLKVSLANLRWFCVGAWVLALVLSLGCGGLSAWAVAMAPEGENVSRIFDNEVELMRSGLLGVMKVRVVHWLVYLIVSPFMALPWIMALMITGVLAYRGGWITGERSTRDYRLLLGLGLLVGLPIAALRTAIVLMGSELLEYTVYFPLNMIDAIALGGAWLAILMLVVKAEFFAAARRILAAVGRMALTNYLAQSILCTLVFYGLGLFGAFSRTELLGFVAVVWALQLVWSPIWLSRFERGPMETLWRRMIYGARPRATVRQG